MSLEGEALQRESARREAYLGSEDGERRSLTAWRLNIPPHQSPLLCSEYRYACRVQVWALRRRRR